MTERERQLAALAEAAQRIDFEQRAAYPAALEAYSRDWQAGKVSPTPNNETLWRTSGRAAHWQRIVTAQAAIRAAGPEGNAQIFEEAMRGA